MSPRKTKRDLEMENARLRAEIEGYKTAIKIVQDYADLMRKCIPQPEPIYVPYVQPVYPTPSTPWYEITCSDTATDLTIRAETSTGMKVQ